MEGQSLADVLAYRHPDVVRRYAGERHASSAEAEEIFGEMLKWLYLCSRSSAFTPGESDVAMTREIAKIDDMWHTFLLFTRDYAEFCDRYFGGFIHHEPTSEAAPGVADADGLRRRLKRQFGLVYDVLGERTLRAWYEERRYEKPVRTHPSA